MAGHVAGYLQRSGETARTITTKLRYADFSIRTRSTSLPVGTDDEERIAELACALLDRALADRPGALRLVGVGVSGLEPFRQLALVGLPKRGQSEVAARRATAPARAIVTSSSEVNGRQGPGSHWVP